MAEGGWWEAGGGWQRGAAGGWGVGWRETYAAGLRESQSFHRKQTDGQNGGEGGGQSFF